MRHHPARLTRERARAVLVVLAGAVAVSVVGACLVGGVHVDLGRAFDFTQPENPDFVILFKSRLPRVLLGAAVGGGLAAAGAALQALLRNPLASPDVIGISGGASVGAICVLALGVAGPAWIVVPGAAFAASVATLGLIVRLSTVHGRLNPYSLLLVGVSRNGPTLWSRWFRSCRSGPRSCCGRKAGASTCWRSARRRPPSSAPTSAACVA